MNKDYFSQLFASLVLCFIVYLFIAGITFQFRNPTANNAACWIHIVDVLSFNKLDKFQGK